MAAQARGEAVRAPWPSPAQRHFRAAREDRAGPFPLQDEPRGRRPPGAAPQVSHSLFFPSHLEEMDKYPVFLDGNHSLVTIQNPNAEGGNLLVIRDSYAHCFSTFLASDYQNIYLVDLRYYRDNLSQFVAEHPVDRVLYLYGVDNLVSDTNSAWLK